MEIDRLNSKLDLQKENSDRKISQISEELKSLSEEVSSYKEELGHSRERLKDTTEKLRLISREKAGLDQTLQTIKKKTSQTLLDQTAETILDSNSSYCGSIEEFRGIMKQIKSFNEDLKKEVNEGLNERTKLLNESVIDKDQQLCLVLDENEHKLRK